MGKNSDTDSIPDPSYRKTLEEVASREIHKGVSGMNKKLLADAALSREKFYEEMRVLIPAMVTHHPEMIRASVKNRGYTIGEPLLTQLAEAEANLATK